MNAAFTAWEVAAILLAAGAAGWVFGVTSQINLRTKQVEDLLKQLQTDVDTLREIRAELIEEIQEMDR